MLFWLGLFLLLLMGVSLGLLGGGGSILAVPILVYVFGQPAHEAIAFSLVLVGATALLAALLHHREEQVDWRCALLFAAAGAPASFFCAQLSSRVDGTLLLFFFSVLMLAAGIAMIRRRPENGAVPKKHWFLLLIVAIALGALTGFLGVGGGFMIVPALVLFVGLPTKRAIGTSLVVIAFNSGVGAAGHWEHLRVDMNLLAAFSAVALAGTFLGVRAAARFHPTHLRRTFAVLVLALGTFMLLRNFPF